MSSCYKIVVSFCLPNDRREFGEREFGEWNNNHGVFLSVKVLSFYVGEVLSITASINH